MRNLVGRSLFLAVMLASAGALAEPTTSEIALARRLFADALVLEGTGNWGEAMLKLKDALAIKETPGLRYHLAHCEEQSGELVAASLDYERAAELIKAGAQAPDVEQLLELANQRLLTQIPKLTLTLPPGVSAATVEIDGHVVSTALIGKATPIDPGKHRVAASADGYSSFQKDLVIGSGETLNLELALTPLAAPAVASNPAPDPKRNGVRAESSHSGFGAREVTLIGEAALVAVGVGVGVGFTLSRGSATDRAERLQSDIDAMSAGNPGACQAAERPAQCDELADALDDRKSNGTIATAGFIGAGVSAAALVTTWLLWPSSKHTVAIQLRPRGVGWDLRAGIRF